MGVLGRLWKSMEGWTKSNAEHVILVPFVDPDGDDNDPHVPENSYVRFWVADSYLAYDQKWGTNRLPTVHAAVEVSFAGRDPVEFAAIAAPGEDAEAQGVHANFALTQLLPYAGELIKLEAGLIALRRDGAAHAALGVITDFGSLIGPPVSAAFTIANKVADGIGALISALDANVILGYTNTFAPGGGGGANVLGPGYIALVKATQKELKKESLEVVDGRLHRIGDVEPLTGFDYMLFRIEKRTERPDWRFPELVKLRKQALDAKARGDKASYDVFKGEALLRCLTSEDLTPHDQVRAAMAMREEFKLLEDAGLGATSGVNAALDDVIQTYAPSADDVRALPRPTLADLMA